MKQAKSLEQLVRQFASQLTAHGFAGEFHLDEATKVVNATDNSIYEVKPLAVAQPLNSEDVQRLMQVANLAQFASLTFCARGGGTGTNGQALTQGIVIDFSRFMTRILDFDPGAATITVEPGVILSDLNRYLQPYGLHFAPHVSTADRATIGGMIATDAAGKGSLIYGKTADHVLGLQAVLANGHQLDTITAKPPLATWQSELAQTISDLLAPMADEIDQRFLPLKRPLSGYNLKQAYSQGKFSFEYLFAGAEGTLGLVTAARLKLMPIPQARALIVIHYPSFIAALNDAQELIALQPLAIEAVDEKVQASAQSLPAWPELARLLKSEGHSYISNFIEFVATSVDELNAKLTEVEALLKTRANPYVVIREPRAINQLWSIRSLAVGLVAKLPGRQKPVAFIEDAIVPPPNLANFVAELQQELDARQLGYAMYGHVDVGCIHVRPALDLQTAPDRRQIRALTDVVLALLSKYNGILWGEHGKGFRGEFVPQVFGPRLYPILCQIKALFDPHNRLNPGKLTAPAPGIALVSIDQVTMRGELDQVIAPSLQQQFSGAMLCNGNGACFNQEPSNVMCPSYKITKERIHSPKGRAMLVKEWLRARALNHNEQQRAHEAFAALAGCLGCKGCAGKCPTQVSIPDLRSQFLNEYHQRYKRRSWRELLLGRIESLVPYLAKVAKLWNFSQRYSLLPPIGLSSLPVFTSVHSLRQRLAKLAIPIYRDASQIPQLQALPRPVVIFADVFSSYFDDNLLRASILCLQQLGFSPAVIINQASGKALIVSGMLDQFRATSARLAALLNPLLAAEIPVVGLENTLVTLFRDEMVKFAKPLVGKVQTLAELLAANLDQLPLLSASGSYRLMPHCTEQALLPSEGRAWQQIFARIGLQLSVVNLGCCGMAGHYGYLSEHQQQARGLFKLNWQVTISDQSEINLASGFSCRSQVAKVHGERPAHPIEIISQVLQISVSAAPVLEKERA